MNKSLSNDETLLVQKLNAILGIKTHGLFHDPDAPKTVMQAIAALYRGNAGQKCVALTLDMFLKRPGAGHCKSVSRSDLEKAAEMNEALAFNSGFIRSKIKGIRGEKNAYQCMIASLDVHSIAKFEKSEHRHTDRMVCTLTDPYMISACGLSSAEEIHATKLEAGHFTTKKLLKTVTSQPEADSDLQTPAYSWSKDENGILRPKPKTV